jgi:hypothetical protein
MEAPNLDGLVPGLIIIGILFCAIVWGLWELVDWLWIDDAIRVTEPLVPELELTVKDNIIDTIYVYRIPE